MTYSYMTPLKLSADAVLNLVDDGTQSTITLHNQKGAQYGSQFNRNHLAALEDSSARVTIRRLIADISKEAYDRGYKRGRGDIKKAMEVVLKTLTDPY